MKLTKLLVMALAIGGLVYAQKTTYNFDKEANFAGYKTYKWVDVKGGSEKLDDLNRKTLESALERHLAAKGLTKTDADTADVYAAYQVGVTANQEYTTFNSGGAGWGYGRGWGGMGTGMSQTTAQTILTGTLVLDLYEPKNKTLVWRGSASDTIDQGAKPEKRAKKIDKAVEKMLKNYPPKVKS